MCDVLIDMQMAETIINDDPYTYGSFRQKNALFQSVFKKHNLTQAEYDSSLIWRSGSRRIGPDARPGQIGRAHV